MAIRDTFEIMFFINDRSDKSTIEHVKELIAKHGYAIPRTDVVLFNYTEGGKHKQSAIDIYTDGTLCDPDNMFRFLNVEERALVKRIAGRMIDLNKSIPDVMKYLLRYR